MAFRMVTGHAVLREDPSTVKAEPPATPNALTALVVRKEKRSLVRGSDWPGRPRGALTNRLRRLHTDVLAWVDRAMTAGYKGLMVLCHSGDGDRFNESLRNCPSISSHLLFLSH